MRCPTCDGESIVKDSRPRPDGGIRRRRECVMCGERWTTVELPVLARQEFVAQVAALGLQLADYDQVGIRAKEAA